jgi:hypothetical protein
VADVDSVAISLLLSKKNLSIRIWLIPCIQYYGERDMYVIYDIKRYDILITRFVLSDYYSIVIVCDLGYYGYHISMWGCLVGLKHGWFYFFVPIFQIMCLDLLENSSELGYKMQISSKLFIVAVG